MKIFINILLLLISLASAQMSFAAVETVSCASMGDQSGCETCFREANYLYTCNPYNAATCNKQAVTYISDTYINNFTGPGNERVIYDHDPGSVNFTRLQTTVDWTISTPNVLDMFQFPAEYMSRRETFGSGDTGVLTDGDITDPSHVNYKEIKWTEFKPSQWLRPDEARIGADREAPAYRVAITPRAYSDASNYTDHRQCIYYFVRFCGDGSVDTDRGEECDDGNMNNGDQCDRSCQIETPAECTNLTVSPSSVSTGGTSQLTCTGQNVNSYQMTITGPGGFSQTINSNSGTTNALSTAGTYTAQCFVDGQGTTPSSCQKTITVVEDPVPSCANLTVSDTNPDVGQQISFNCSGNNSPSSYTITLFRSGQAPQVFSTSSVNYSVPNTPGEIYTVECRVEGETSTVPSCRETFTVDTPNPICANLSVSPSSVQEGGSVNFSCTGINSSSTRIDVSGPGGFSQTITGSSTTASGSLVLNTIGSYSAQCVVDGSISSPTCQKNVTVTEDPTPSIRIIKDDNDNHDDHQIVNEGETAYFDITVFNDGEVSLENVVITDPRAPDCNRSASETRSLYAGNTFDPGETFTYTCSDDHVQNSYTNIAEVCGDSVEDGQEVCDDDPTYVTVIGSTCDDVYISPSYIEVGGSSYVTCRGSNVSSYRIEVDGPAGFFEYVNAPTLNVHHLDVPGVYDVRCIVNGNITNNSCEGTIHVSDIPDFSDPGLIIEKNDADNYDDNQEVREGDDAVFTITVRNTGNEVLTDVEVSDFQAPDCNRYIGTLDPGEVFEYVCYDHHVTHPYTNIARVCGDAPDGTLCDEDPSYVHVYNIPTPGACDYIFSSNGQFGGVPMSTTLSCKAGPGDFCQIYLYGPDGRLENRFDTCVQDVTLYEYGQYHAKCVVNGAIDVSRACQIDIFTEPVTTPPTGTNEILLILLGMSVAGVIIWKRRKIA